MLNKMKRFMNFQKTKKLNYEEKDMCKICSKIMHPKTCVFHKVLTGHNEFKPFFNRTRKLKGGEIRNG